jgi:hypothetical protein
VRPSHSGQTFRRSGTDEAVAIRSEVMDREIAGERPRSRVAGVVQGVHRDGILDCHLQH